MSSEQCFDLMATGPSGVAALETQNRRFPGRNPAPQPMWEGTQSWAVPLASTEFPVGRAGAAHRRRPARKRRLVVSVAPPAGSPTRTGPPLLGRPWSTSPDSGAEVALAGAGDATHWGGWTDIPDMLRQSIGLQLAMFGSNGNGATPAMITSIAADVKNVDQTSAARLGEGAVVLAAVQDAARRYAVPFGLLDRRRARRLETAGRDEEAVRAGRTKKRSSDKKMR